MVFVVVEKDIDEVHIDCQQRGGGVSSNVAVSQVTVWLYYM